MRSAPGPGVLRAGLTGGIASGKSTVGRMMAEEGCFVTDADRLVDELYRPRAAGTREVERLFGEELLDRRGGVDKARLATVVFADPAARRQLEAAIHPLVAARFEELARSHGGVVVFEATLLVETGGAARFDRLVTVEADPELRIERAIARGMPEADARARLAAQATPEQRTAAADHVIVNEGTLEELHERVAEVVAELSVDVPG
ncbi:MAG TPA: dephospho-CoA kinase [Thermoanaerobaculia bacterium]|nr:dephospho-CoA kinase [Thermoanaerobaculia bacterium]